MHVIANAVEYKFPLTVAVLIELLLISKKSPDIALFVLDRVF